MLGLFLTGLLLPLCVAALSRNQLPDGDFVAFYTFGRILNEHPARDLYNFELQKKLCNEVHPLKTGSYGPFPFPPFVGVLFRPFAKLPYVTAYPLWAAISLALYTAGLAVTGARYFSTGFTSAVFDFLLCSFLLPVRHRNDGQWTAFRYRILRLGCGVPGGRPGVAPS